MPLARFGGELALRTGGRRPDKIAAATRADLATELPGRFDSARKHACRRHDVGVTDRVAAVRSGAVALTRILWPRSDGTPRRVIGANRAAVRAPFVTPDRDHPSAHCSGIQGSRWSTGSISAPATVLPAGATPPVDFSPPGTRRPELTATTAENPAAETDAQCILIEPKRTSQAFCRRRPPARDRHPQGLLSRLRPGAARASRTSPFVAAGTVGCS
jgi:hypothetical protein